MCVCVRMCMHVGVSVPVSVPVCLHECQVCMRVCLGALLYLNLCVLGSFGAVPHRQHVFIGVINHTEEGSSILQAEEKQEGERGKGEKEPLRGHMTDGEMMQPSHKSGLMY